MRTPALLLTAISTLLLGAANSAQAASVTVTASALNVRSGPSTRYRVMTSVRRGAVLESLGTSGSWTLVQLQGRRGYAFSRYLRANPAGSGSSGGSASTGGTSTSGEAMSVTASALNVRSGPSTRYRKLGTLRRGASVRVLSRQGAWSRIAYGNGAAWVHGDYLAKPGSTGSGGGTSTGGRPTSRAGYIQLATSGTHTYGYYTSARRWGRPAMVYGIERAARKFRQANPGAPRVGVGDISAQNGGRISGHASHRLGVDADLLPVRNDGREARVSVGQSAYSRTLTRKLLQRFEAELRVTHIFFNDSQIHTAHRQYWKNHSNHFHVRIR
jgi:uncharacterized protein YraI